MEKDTKTFRCDGCKKTVVLDFYKESARAENENALLGWVTLRISAVHRDGKPIVALETSGHACSEACVHEAFTNLVDKKMPEQLRKKT